MWDYFKNLFKKQKSTRVFDLINAKVVEIEGIKIIIGREILKHVVKEKWEYQSAPTVESIGFLFDRFVDIELRDDDRVEIFGAEKRRDVLRFLA